jgi:hypothetical protein
LFAANVRRGSSRLKQELLALPLQAPLHHDPHEVIVTDDEHAEPAA